MQKLPKHVHVIGICGVATSALAIAFHDKGVKVTGSDKGFFPPVSTELEKHGIPFYAGWHPEKMTDGPGGVGKPDIIIVGTASGTQNPETAYAKENDIAIYSYPEIIGKYFAKKRSVVCAGTWGKTSSAALLSFIFSEAGLDPSYMFGGVSLSHQSSAKLGGTDWSIFEGDEYKSSPTDRRAKFFHYKATDVLLSAVSWDHADLYPTEAAYFEAFEKLMKMIPENGVVVSCKDNAGVNKIVSDFNGKIVRYGRAAPSTRLEANLRADAISGPSYEYGNVVQTKEGLNFSISYNGKSWHVHAPILGLYQAENITGCFAMAHELGVKPEKIVAAISKFKGLKRRMEKRMDGATSKKGVTVVDDIAHSPEKALSVLNTLRSIYDGKVVAVFEPNIGGRERGAAAKYDNAFNDADTVIIPRLTKLKIAGDGSDRPMEGDELASMIGKTHPDARDAEDDAALVELLVSMTKKGDVIAFLGSHGFRGMIESAIEQLN
jgi:UDP-N-acetylmuramate: L-alanyl-gamma-D-glutamyl-meso-diaminopimelate ligase